MMIYNFYYECKTSQCGVNLKEKAMDSIKGKVALVTGSSQGLGKVIAEMLAEAGCHVIVNAAHDLAKARGVADSINAKGLKASAKCFDVSDEHGVAEAFAAIEAEAGSLDILVNNARLDPYKRKPEMSEGQWWDMVLQVNLKGCFICSLEFFKRAKSRQWGRIVNVSSVRSFIPAEPNMIAYGVSKLGMHAVTRSFAENGAPFNITANTVAPGMIITENIDKRLTPEMKARESAKIPLGRGGTCEEIADSVLFVVRNGYVTGETININGGMHYAP
jgi:3-oxoacyl-[acyl-carrier protein] reductase